MLKIRSYSGIYMKWTNSNGFLRKEVAGERKNCPDYTFIKKSLNYCWTATSLI